AGSAAVEIKMVRELAKLYDVPYEEERAKTIVLSLLGSYAATKGGYAVGGSLMKTLPVIGTTLALAAMTAYDAGVTEDIGGLFIQHFVAGGTLLDFKVEKLRTKFSKSGAAA